MGSVNFWIRPEISGNDPYSFWTILDCYNKQKIAVNTKQQAISLFYAWDKHIYIKAQFEIFMTIYRNEIMSKSNTKKRSLF